MRVRVLFLFGPNLGALGRREPERYGTQTLEEIMDEVAERGARLGHELEGCGLPVVEVHMTNIYAREEFRRHSVISAACRATIAGAGAGGYHVALEALPWITG